MTQEIGLERELAFFEKNKANYLETHPGLFALIKGDVLIGVYPTAEEAYQAGLKKIGLEPFLVKQIVEKEPIGFVPVLFLAQR